MKVLLKIGYTTFLLPNDVGVQNVMKVMAKALRAEDRTYLRSDPFVTVDQEPLEVSFKYLQPGQIKLRQDPDERPPEPLRLNAPESIIMGDA